MQEPKNAQESIYIKSLKQELIPGNVKKYQKTQTNPVEQKKIRKKEESQKVDTPGGGNYWERLT